jgi:hypothetical protein
MTRSLNPNHGEGAMAKKGKGGKKVRLSDLKITKGGGVKGGGLTKPPARLNK